MRTRTTGKPQLTREELARMILEQVPHLRLWHAEVYPDKKLNWTARVSAPPRLLADVQPIIDDIVNGLRETYDLKIEPRERLLLSIPGWQWITGRLARFGRPRHRAGPE